MVHNDVTMLLYFYFYFFFAITNLKNFSWCSEYVNTHPIAHGDLILPADQWILNLLTWIGNLILVVPSLKILKN